MRTDVAATRFGSPDDLLSAVGRKLGTTPWFTVEPRHVEKFARATGTTSTDRTSQSGEVPSFMVLSLTNYFLPQLLEVGGISSGVNYGSGSIRFGVPVRAGNRLRATAAITEAGEVQGGVQTTTRIVVEVDGASEPACLVDSVSRWLR